ncbi:MAG: cellobiose phosphorylase [Tenericutes bacterium]|nr:cellobiose phosphorylase [Mycoplasmatota bacterium]
MKEYYFKNEEFIIKNYLHKSAFSNFLPSLAGKKGIPLWTFYVNRGQGISGFGLQNKNHPIMEFTPANKAYESVGQFGFRTFITANGKYYEPFLPTNNANHRMSIQRSSFSIEEENKELGLSIKIKYFGLPNENIGALVRRVTIQNIGKKPLNLEVLDGLTEVIPSGVRNSAFKEMSNLLSSWMDVEELENNYAFYNLRSSTGDSSEVKEIESGNYLFGVVNNQLVKPIVDQDLVFGYDNLKRTANVFIEKGLKKIQASEQVTVNKLACGYIPYAKELEVSETLEIDILVGFAHSKEILKSFIERATTKSYINSKDQEAKQVVEELVNDVTTDTGSHIFNEYVKQSYLDNLLRGGYPYKIGNSIYHLYSRRHGDLERDYNFFNLAPEFYSQGGGNFRDVCQNRRMDSFIHRDVQSHNIKHFASLIQMDGFNPLTVDGLKFSINNDDLIKELVNKHFKNKLDIVENFLKSKFTPGGLINFIHNNNINYIIDELTCLNDIISNSNQEIQSSFGEGYWSDHFTYIIDLVESYEGIYPDKLSNLLFNESDILSFESPVTVLSRNEKAVINSKGKIRQYGSLLHFDEEKISKLHLNKNGSNWVQLNNENYKTNLFTKLLILVINKHSQLDHDGLGIEMESEKPGWNDAMNGLPGLFGSGVGETIELKRIVHFLKNHLKEETVTLPIELVTLLNNLENSLDYFKRLDSREAYRTSIRFGLSGKEVVVKNQELKEYLENLDQYLSKTFDDLFEESNAIIPTFLTYEVSEFKEVLENGNPVIGNYGLALVEPKKYSRKALPNFLEAPARLLKTDFNQDKLKRMYKAIKQSDIYDKKLKIYKTSGTLEKEGYEIGRIRAFTAGWLERESDFLHMIYKYLIGLLKAGLYEEFYKELNDNFVCFMDPEVYGRNILENSSFIAPSNNPNPKIHGKGFLPRLSGSTVEAIEIWVMMMTGGSPFKLVEGELVFQPNPLFSKEFFKEDFTVTYRFMKDVDITYISNNKFDTYESCIITKFELITEYVTEVVNNGFVDKDQAKMIRDGFYKRIKIYIEKN